MSPKKQTALITGASSGIGAEIAKKFSKEGYDLLLLGRNKTRLIEVKNQCSGAKCDFLAFDLLDTNQNFESIKQKLSELSPISILVNNAGIYKPGAFLETSDADWISQFQINLFSAIQLTKLVWPEFKKNKKGSILNISSTLGIKPTSNTGAYSATKAAMINWTLSLAQEGGADNIRVNCICPGIVDTPIHDFHTLASDEKNKITSQLSSYQLLNSIGQPTDIAESAYFIASDLSRWTTGAILSVDGGIGIK